MKGFSSFLAKECRELLRTKRLMILLIVFLAFGLMDVLTAMLTPKIMEMMADQYAEMGIQIGEIQVTALDAWTQFAKNMPMALIVLLLMFSSIYSAEYTKGTLIPLLTKGLSRSAVVLAKFAVMLFTWSAGILLCFGVTYFYSDYYWDNTIVKELLFACFGWWLFGVLMLSLIVFFSSFAGSAAQVLLGVGAVYFGMTLCGMFVKVKEYLPTYLCSSLSLYRGEMQPYDCSHAVMITAGCALLFVLAALPLTNKRQL